MQFYAKIITLIALCIPWGLFIWVSWCLSFMGFVERLRKDLGNLRPWVTGTDYLWSFNQSEHVKRNSTYIYINSTRMNIESKLTVTHTWWFLLGRVSSFYICETSAYLRFMLQLKCFIQRKMDFWFWVTLHPLANLHFGSCHFTPKQANETWSSYWSDSIYESDDAQWLFQRHLFSC